MEKINFTDYKKLTVEEIKEKIPFEVMYNAESVFRVVPKSWHNPAFPVH